MLALVTGANRGIGHCVVDLICAADPKARVFLAARNLAEGQVAAAALSKVHGDRIVAVQLDVRSADSIKGAVATVSEATGGTLDVLVNNAGILLESDEPAFGFEARETLATNFEGVVAVTTAFLPLLLRSPRPGHILSTSSGVGARTLGLFGEADRAALRAPTQTTAELRAKLSKLIDALEADPAHPYHAIPTVGYGISKLGVNCYTELLAREHPTLRANACSPGFCNTGMCGPGYTGKRVPKEPALGADVFKQVLFGELGAGKTSTFFKEASAPGTPLEAARSVVDPWVQCSEKARAQFEHVQGMRR